MSIGRVVSMRQGKQNRDRLYIQLKNGSVYCYHRTLDESTLKSLVSKINTARGEVKALRSSGLWIHVRKSDGTLVQRS